MARPRAIEPEDLRNRLEAGESYESIANALTDEGRPITAPALRQMSYRYRDQIPRKGMSHKWAKPWPLTEAQHHSRAAQYLQTLSTVAQGGEARKDDVVTALRWAELHIAARRTIDYDPEMPPNEESRYGGLYARPLRAGERSHLNKVVRRAREGLAKRRLSSQS